MNGFGLSLVDADCCIDSILPNVISDSLKVGQYLLLLFIFHLDVTDYNNLKGKILPPKLEGEKMGIFATRTPHRYNPIGLSI